MHLISTSRRRIPTGWKILGLAVTLTGVFFVTDGALTNRVPLTGYCPEAADIVVYAPDIAHFWGETLRQDQVRRIRGDWTRAGANTEFVLRQTTGIRPTPGRWRIWMGRRFVASSGPDGDGICTSPGLLLRMLGQLHGLVTKPDADGVRMFGDQFYAWRDQSLIVSSDAAYVRAALRASPIEMAANLTPRTLMIESRVEPRVKLELHAARHFPLFGELPDAITQRNAPMTLPNAWDSVPMAACTASNWDDIATLLRLADHALVHAADWPEARSFAAELFETWSLGEMPRQWQDNRLDHCTLALTGINTESRTPYPSLAFIIRSQLPVTGDHPLLGVMPADAERIPYEWSGYPGALFPMAGPNWAPCLGNRGRDWVAASNEPLMRTLVGDIQEGAAVDADFTIQIDWAQVSNALVSLISKHNSHELFQEMNRDEVRWNMIPIARAVRHLGRTELLGRTENGRTTFEGLLARETGAATQ